MSPTEAAEGNSGGGRAGEPPTPPVYYRSPRRLVWGSTLRPSPNLEGLGCREDYFEAHLCGSYVYCDLPVRLHACSPPRLTATQLARSSVLNRLIAPAGLSPALRRALRAHRDSKTDPTFTLLSPPTIENDVRKKVRCQNGLSSEARCSAQMRKSSVKCCISCLFCSSITVRVEKTTPSSAAVHD